MGREIVSGKKGKIVLALIAGVLLVVFARFFIGGDEDSWVCEKGQWVKHGNPSASEPKEQCK